MLRRLGSRIVLVALVFSAGLARTAAADEWPPFDVLPRGGCQAVGARVGSDDSIVANRKVNPCASEEAEVARVTVRAAGTPYVVSLTDPFVYTALGYSYGDGIAPGLNARSTVADGVVGIQLSPAWVPMFGVRAVSAYVIAGAPSNFPCPTLESWMARSSVADVYLDNGMIGPRMIPVGDKPMDILLPAGVLHLNWQRLTATELVQRAVWLDTGNPASDVVIAEVRLTSCPA
jgi:hypothetical protein